MLRYNVTLAALCGAAFAVAGPASATTMENLTFDDIVAASTACVVAEAGDVSYTEINGSVFTLTSFTVTKAAFGLDEGAQFTLATPGGRLSGGSVSMTEVNAGAPRFFKSRESLMLIEPASGGNYRLVGYNQGLFNVFDGNAQLPFSIGGPVDVDEAIDIVNERRSRGPGDGIAD